MRGKMHYRNLCREKGMTVKQATLYSVCMVYTKVYEKCLSDIDSRNANIPLFMVLLLLTGDRPGTAKVGLLSVTYDEIELSEKEGVFKLQFTGSLKASKYSTKTIIVNQKIYKIINERKRKNSATEKLFGDLKIMNHKHKWAFIKPWFRLDMARKIAISSLFFINI
jgi:hypothetical protein